MIVNTFSFNLSSELAYAITSLDALIKPTVVDVVAPPTINAPVTDVVPAFNVTAPFTVKLVSVPTDVIALCAAVVTVPAVVAVDALPVNAPTNVVEVTEVNPAIVVADEPNDIAVLPTVTDELVNLAFDIEPANIPSVTFNAPIVVALPVEVTSPVKFAFVVTVLALPVKAPTNVVDVTEVRPAIVVADEPNDIAVEPTVTDELVKEAFAILLNVLFAPLIVLFVSVCVPLIVAISSSDPKGPAIHLSVVVFHNNEPDTNDAAVASLTTKPPFAAPEPFNDIILSPISTVVELTVVDVPDTTKLPPIVTVVPSSVIDESPTVDDDVNLTTLLLVPDVVIDVPEEPFDPLEPDVPDEPFDPLEPEVPEEPFDPLEPEVPEEPFDPELPDVPLVPEEPFDPLEPEVPEEPFDPLEPDVPAVPDEPEEPLVPDEPFEPLEPDVPDEPFDPLEPEVPEEPFDPLEPEVPAVPELPEEPLEPEVPEEPFDPLEPDVPEVPDVAAVYDVPFIIKLPVIATDPDTCWFALNVLLPVVAKRAEPVVFRDVAFEVVPLMVAFIVPST